MAGKIRVGIVGATVTPGGSGWGANAHVPAIHALADYELAAVCTSREETAKASAEKFGARLAFSNIEDMVHSPDVDLVVVCVRVPWHKDLVMSALSAGKPTFCEWPLGANLGEAQEMTNLANSKNLRTMIGLQARSDPTIMYARDLVAQGYVGDVLAANLHVVGGAQLVRGPGRIWQGQKSNGANTFTIAGGHAIDAMCAVLGEFTDVAARLATRIPNWQTEEGQPVPVDSPDVINFVGALESGAEVSVNVCSLPTSNGGTTLEIYGRDGTIVIPPDGPGRGALNIGPSIVYGAKGNAELAPMPAPDEYRLAPEGTPAGSPYNVAQAYARNYDAAASGQAFDVDFNLALTRHQLLDAIERSAAEGKAVKL